MSLRRLIQKQLKIAAEGGETVISQPLLSKKTVSTIITAGAGTYTATQLLGGLILRDPVGADRTDTTDTATLIIDKINSVKVGTSLEFIVRNTADGDEVITVAGGTGVTMSGKVTVNRGESRRFIFVVTSITSKTITIYDIGLVTNTYTVQSEVTDISTASSAGVVVAPYAGRLIRVYTCLHTIITTGDAVITIASSVGNVTETITIAQSGSAVGDIDVINPAVQANTVIAAGTALKATSNGGSTVASRISVVFEIERD